MEKHISLEKLYEIVADYYPDIDHDSEIFKKNIVDVLNQDPIRTSNVRKQILEKGMDYQISSQFPVTDFIHGCFNYLVDLGLTEEDAAQFADEYINKEELFR
jgi:hypothetical protein